MAQVQWSFSSMKTFKTCQLQYHDRYILKNKEPPGDAAMYGSDVHEAIEQYLRDDIPIPAKFARFHPQVEPIKSWPGDLYVEHKMALDRNLNPCAFDDPDYFVRGIADVLYVHGKKARVLDWKTGSSAKYADLKQLELMALMAFKHFPDVDEVSGRLFFLVPDIVVPSHKPAVYLREDSATLWEGWLYEVKRMQMTIDSGKFTPNPNGLCKRYCPVVTCMHNGRSTG